MTRPKVLAGLPFAFGLGLAAGWLSFAPFLKIISGGLLPRLVWISQRAETHAHGSYALACGLALGSVPLAALLAGRFRRRAPYAVLQLKALGTLAGVWGIASLVYRWNLKRPGAFWRDIKWFWSESESFVVGNPLTQIALAAGLGVWLFGLWKAWARR